MTETEYKKRLLLYKIESQRKLFHLEASACRHKVWPLAALLVFVKEVKRFWGDSGVPTAESPSEPAEQESKLSLFEAILTLALPLLRVLVGSPKPDRDEK